MQTKLANTIFARVTVVEKDRNLRTTFFTVTNEQQQFGSKVALSLKLAKQKI